MDTQNQLIALLDLAERLHMEIRRVPLDGEGGGLCRLKGQCILFVDTSASATDQLARTAAALASLNDWQDTYLLPEIRELLERYR